VSVLGAAPAKHPAAAPRPAASAALPKVEFEKYVIPNGLQVILHVDRKLPIVHVNQWFGLSMVAALHPVNAMVMAYATLSLAKRSSTYWSEEPEAEPMRTPSAVEASPA